MKESLFWLGSWCEHAAFIHHSAPTGRDSEAEEWKEGRDGDHTEDDPRHPPLEDLQVITKVGAGNEEEVLQ